VCFVNLNQFFGNAMRSTPKALLDDGKFDVFVAKENVNRGDGFRLFALVKEGRHYTDDNINIEKGCYEEYQTNSMKIQIEEKEVWGIDGELYGPFNDCEVVCIPKAFEVFHMRTQKK